jgi:hypothetical protein
MAPRIWHSSSGTSENWPLLPMPPSFSFLLHPTDTKRNVKNL